LRNKEKRQAHLSQKRKEAASSIKTSVKVSQKVSAKK
jgi:hypothetical protein